ncbi:hypothetical protein C0J52_07291 [Blattella germanica]|nr:hypothetical protein C0J52_07291 [Blattella germanica]
MEICFRIILDRTKKHVTAKVVHYTGSEVITASTREWAIKKFLFRTTDVSAYINLAHVFAQRCLESGITEVYCDLDSQPGGKVEAFIKNLEVGGLTLSEPPRFLPHRPWDMDRPEKPWEVTV